VRIINPPLNTQLRTLVVGQLVASDDAHDLSQNMIEIELPNGVVVHAGWFPESSADGAYRISVFQGLEELVAPIFTTDPNQAAQDIAALAHYYNASRGIDTVDNAESGTNEFYASVDHCHHPVAIAG